jgi:hypothetical protein
MTDLDPSPTGELRALVARLASLVDLPSTQGVDNNGKPTGVVPGEVIEASWGNAVVRMAQGILSRRTASIGQTIGGSSVPLQEGALDDVVNVVASRWVRFGLDVTFACDPSPGAITFYVAVNGGTLQAWTSPTWTPNMSVTFISIPTVLAAGDNVITWTVVASGSNAWIAGSSYASASWVEDCGHGGAYAQGEVQ